jgi:hypothetical protein
MSEELVNTLVFVFVFIVVPGDSSSGSAWSAGAADTTVSTPRRRSRRPTGPCAAA